jgi:hypothetical protein
MSARLLSEDGGPALAWPRRALVRWIRSSDYARRRQAKRKRPMRSIAASLILLLPAVAVGQRLSRFVPIQIDGDPERIFNEQLLRIQPVEKTLERIKHDLKKGFDPKELLERLDKMGFNPTQHRPFLDGPELKQGLQALTQDQRQKFEEGLQKLAEQHAAEAAVGPMMLPPPAPGAPEPRAPMPVPPPKVEPKEDLEEAVLRWLKNRMDDMDGSRFAEFFQKYPVWTEALSDLRLSVLDADGASSLGEWAKRWLPDASGTLERLGRLDLPPLSLPSLNLRMPRLKGPSLPRLGTPSLPSAGFFTGLQWVLWIILAAAIAVTLAYLLRRRQALAIQQRDKWRLGPWPVDPAHVASAAEMMRAFEYLAFARLGLDAQACNHRTLAQRLAPPDEPAPTRQAAHQLARLYEQARYAPDVSLTADSLGSARRHLCLLAGRTPS